MKNGRGICAPGSASLPRVSLINAGDMNTRVHVSQHMNTRVRVNQHMNTRVHVNQAAMRAARASVSRRDGAIKMGKERARDALPGGPWRPLEALRGGRDTQRNDVEPPRDVTGPGSVVLMR